MKQLIVWTHEEGGQLHAAWGDEDAFHKALASGEIDGSGISPNGSSSIYARLGVRDA